MSWRASASLPTTVTATGVRSRFSERRWAVTTISSSPLVSAAGSAAATCVWSAKQGDPSSIAIAQIKSVRLRTTFIRHLPRGCNRSVLLVSAH